MTVSAGSRWSPSRIWFFVIAGPGPLAGPGQLTCAELRISGIHHVTVLCKDAGRSVDFYRNLLGMRALRQGTSQDDPGARHLFFGDAEGRPGTLVTCLEYPH